MSRHEANLYSPLRLHDNSIKFHVPGDRFIPTRSLMNLDLARCSLRTKTQETSNATANSCIVTNAKEEYRRKVEENLALDSNGRPFRMLVFRGSLKPCGRTSNFVEETMRQDRDRSYSFTYRHFPKSPDRILDAPRLIDDYYLNLLDWGANNVLAVALGKELFLWNAGNGISQKLMEVDENSEDYLSSVAWSQDGRTVAVGLSNSKVQLWDVTKSSMIRSLKGHRKRVGSLSWNGCYFLTSGSRDNTIINHDVRARTNLTSCLQGHTEEVCGLRWSGSGNILASGGNDNFVHIWEASKAKYLHRFNDHRAAIKALAWCPYQPNILASGGGTADRCIKIWNTQSGQCLNSLDTKAQVCSLEWNRNHKELLSSHGFSQNQLCLWSYPSMSKIGEITGHTSRILHTSQNPDGSTVVSAGADETLRFWKVFVPPRSTSSKMEEKEVMSPLSTKRFHIR